VYSAGANYLIWATGSAIVLLMLVFPEVEYRSIAGSRSAFVAAEFMPVKMFEAVRLCRLLFLRFLSCRVLICLHVVPNLTEPALALVVDHHHHDHPMNLELPGVLAGRHLLTMPSFRWMPMTLGLVWNLMVEVHLLSLDRLVRGVLRKSVLSVWNR